MWFLTLIVNIALRQVECPERNLVFSIGVPRSERNIHRGSWKFRSILFRPKAYYDKALPEAIIGPFIMCLDIPGSDVCFHGWHNSSVLGKRVSSECFRMTKPDIRELWLRTTMDTKVIIE